MHIAAVVVVPKVSVKFTVVERLRESERERDGDAGRKAGIKRGREGVEGDQLAEMFPI